MPVVEVTGTTAWPAAADPSSNVLTFFAESKAKAYCLPWPAWAHQAWSDRKNGRSSN